MRDVKIGAPGFILVKELYQDFCGTLRRLKDMGFDGLEITGFFGKSAEELRNAFSESGLEPFGCYAPISLMLCESSIENVAGWEDFLHLLKMPGDTPDEVMEYIRSIGCKYIGLCMTNSEPAQETFDKIARVSAYAKKHGMTLQYHNHDWEYINMVNGEYRMDRILKNIPSEVNFEPDLGWMEIGGYDCREAIRTYAKRIEIVHLKDYYRQGPDVRACGKEYFFRPTGYGVMNWAEIVPLCEQLIQPEWYVADHDSCYDRDVLHELELSARYIRELLPYTSS